MTVYIVIDRVDMSQNKLLTNPAQQVVKDIADLQADVAELQSVVGSGITNPYVGKITASDFESDNITSYDSTIQSLVGSNATLVDNTANISSFGGYTNIINDFARYQGFAYEEPTALNHITPKIYVDTKLALAGGSMSGPLIQNDNTPSVSPLTGCVVAYGGLGVGGEIRCASGIFSDGNVECTQLVCNDATTSILDLSTATVRHRLTTNESTKTFTLSNDVRGNIIEYSETADVFEFLKPIKLNSTILDSNDDQSYILKKGLGIDSYEMGKNASSGRVGNNRTLAIGVRTGNVTNLNSDSVLLGANIAQFASANPLINNVCIGEAAGYKLGGNNNVFIGKGSGFNNENSFNTFVGSSSGYNSTGSSIAALGYGAGITSGNNSTHIGRSAVGVDALANQISLGYQATTTATNQCVVGNSSINQFLSDGFRDLDTKTGALTLAVGKTNASKVEIGKTGANTEIMGDLKIIGGIRNQITKFYNGTSDTDRVVKLYTNGLPGMGEYAGITNIGISPYNTENRIMTWTSWGGGGGLQNGNLLRFYVSDVEKVLLNSTTMTVNNQIYTTDTTVSTTTANGALVVAGGAGIDGNLNVGGDIKGDNGSAWGFYEDGGATNYPLVINAGVTATLPNDGLSGITNITQLPSNGYNFYDASTNKFVPELSGDSYTLGIRITASSSSVNGSGELRLNIGAGTIILNLGVVNFPKGSGVSTNFDKTTSVFTLATFVANGAVVEYTSLVGNTTFESVGFHIVRTHRAR